MSKLLCLYHDNCADGFASAWAVWRKFGPEVELRPWRYGMAPPAGPEFSGRDVLIVDFSFERFSLMEFATRNRSVVVLDHHKTAAEDLQGFARPRATYALTADAAWHDELGGGRPGNLAVLFDMSRSGAGITWDFLHGAPRSPLINLVEDRDLWRFKNPDSKNFHALASSYGYSLTEETGGLANALMLWEKWNRLALKHPGNLWRDLLNEGAAILRYEARLIDDILKNTRRMMKIGGSVIPVACVPGQLASDAGAQLNRLVIEYINKAIEAFTATYYDNADGKRHFSLRSLEGGADVSAIARRYGGGGHVHAAGFVMPIGWEGET